MKKLRFVHLLGITGVESHETAEARRWANRLEWPVLCVVLWIPFQWYLEETSDIPLWLGHIADWLVWLVFVIETTLLTSLVKDKRSYLSRNWMNLLIIIGSIPLLWHFTPLAGLLRSLRLFMVVMLLTRMSRNIRKLLSMHQLGATLAVSLVTMVLSGVMITQIEPSIGSVWDGIWWAWVTMSTVGYGDIVPISGGGRLFSSFLILFGIVLLSLLTANLAAFFIGGDVRKVEEDERDTHALLQDIATRLTRIEQRLDGQDHLDRE